MKKQSVLPVFIIFSILMTGCWDQRLLKDSRLVFASAFDLTENGKVMATAVIRDFSNETPINLMVQGVGNTLRETRIKMNNKISGTFEPSKNRVFVLGEDLAKEDVLKYLDIFYRDPNSSLSAKIAVAEGMGADILKVKETKNTLIAEYLLELIKDAEDSSITPNQNIHSISTFMQDEGKDFVVPLLKIKAGEVVLDGTAMFHDHSLAGTLTPDESTLYLIMANKKGRIARYVSKIDGYTNLPLDQFITYNFSRSKSRMKIKSATPENIQVEIEVKTELSVVEFPEDQLTDEKRVKKLNAEISRQLTKQAEEFVQKIQSSNCDLFEIGRELIAFHPKTWKQVKWDETYPTITITPKFKAEIVSHGIIN